MSKVANTEGIKIGNNAGEVGSANAVDVQGGLGHNTSLGNTTDVKAKLNTDKGRIGAENEYEIKGGLKDASVGNTAKVDVGRNSGKIGAGNKINIG